MTSGAGEKVLSWNAKTGKGQRSYLPHALRSPYGFVLSRDTNVLCSICADRSGREEIWLWDATTGKQRAGILNKEIKSSFLGGVAALADNSGDIALSPDGTTLATRGPPPFALWDTKTGRARHKLSPRRGYALRGFSNGSLENVKMDFRTQLYGRWIEFSPDGKILAVYGLYSPDGRKIRLALRLWDSETRQLIATLPDTAYITGIAFSPDGTRLACSFRYGKGDPANGDFVPYSKMANKGNYIKIFKLSDYLTNKYQL